MEKGGLIVGEEQFVPVWVVYWVYDLETQWNGFDLLVFIRPRRHRFCIVEWFSSFNSLQFHHLQISIA